MNRRKRTSSPRADKPAGLPLLLLPVWWALGLAFAFLPFLGIKQLRRVPLGAIRPEIVCFLLGSAMASLSAIQVLASPNRLLAALLRLGAYWAALGAYLCYRHASSVDGPAVLIRLRNQLHLLVAASCGLSLLGLIFPGRIYTAPISWLVPSALSGEEFIHNIQRIRLTTPLNEFNDQLGFSSRRPTAFFLHSNDWGAAITVMAVVVFSDLRRIATKWGALTLMALAACIVFSLNRGAWLAILVAAAAVIWTAKVQVGVAGITMLSMVAFAVAVVVSPVFGIIETRLDNGHSDEFRRDITSEAFTRSMDRPLLGFGAPIDSQMTDQTFARVGTHGQLPAFLVSHGMIAAALFSCFMVAIVRRGFKESDPALAASASALAVLGLFYEVTAAPLFFLMAVAGVRAGESRFHAAANPSGGTAASDRPSELHPTP